MVQLVRMWQLEETHVMPFQFHYGSISSKENSWYSREIENFNSTMVQLVQIIKQNPLTGFELFQFHYGSISSLICH